MIVILSRYWLHLLYYADYAIWFIDASFCLFVLYFLVIVPQQLINKMNIVDSPESKEMTETRQKLCLLAY